MRKNLMKKISKLFLMMIACLLVVSVNAETVPSTLKMTYYTQSSTPMSFPANFHVKKTTDGKYAYCTYYSKNPPVKSIKYTKNSLITDNGMNYILKKAYSSKNDNSFFIYQTALWLYMVDKGKMQGAYYDLTVFKSRVNSGSSATAKKIRNLVSNAKKASANDTKAPTIVLNTTNATFALDSSGKYYVSTPIKVTSSTGKYTVAFTSAPTGTTYTAEGDSFYVKVPKSAMTSLTTKVTLTVSNSKDIYKSYYYKPSNSAYQTMATTYKVTKTASTSMNLSIQTTAAINILKTDADGKALKGAGLQVVNSAGKVIASWTSGEQQHTISGLTEGTYTVKEISAPAGYKLSTNTVKFTVGSDGKVKDAGGNVISLISFKNEKTAITISKQDITSKSELPGATLVIKNKDGKEVVKWTSSTKRYVIKGLAAGTYTLTETIAPEGYALSTETITFTIDKYGKLYNGNGSAVDHIVMYNSPIKTQDVAISKRDITSNEEVAGATLVLKDASGNVVENWVSTTEDHVIKKLKAGTYTLTETIAPEGYIKTEETITFKIDDEGKLYDKDGNSISKVIMYNQKKVTGGGVSISKQDITNGKELPGATLVVKDSAGNVVDTWVSTDTPHLIENLKAGMYTLTETIQPEGYVLSTETISFTVKDDGTVTKVVMYNSPNSKEVPVENTASFKTVTSTIAGLLIIVIGSVMVFKTFKTKEN